MDSLFESKSFCIVLGVFILFFCIHLLFLLVFLFNIYFTPQFYGFCFLFYVVHDHSTLAPEILEKYVSDMTHMYYNWPGTFVSFWFLMFKLHFLYFVYVYNLFSV